METINCPICETKVFKDYISVGDRFNEHEDNQFNIVKCNCGLIFLNPRPTEDQISQYYENAEYEKLGTKMLGIKIQGMKNQEDEMARMRCHTPCT